MQQERNALDSRPGSTGFAGLLASLTAARPQESANWLGGDSSSSLGGLEDDVATLSYERALETHTRYKPAATEPPSMAAAENWTAAPRQAPGVAANRPDVVVGREAHPDGKRKRASVTVRMSEAEAIQLQQRAAEAGITVSAYLRSCTFEVEALRTQVKQALAALRAAQAAPITPRHAHRAGLSWLHLFRRPVEADSELRPSEPYDIRA